MNQYRILRSSIALFPYEILDIILSYYTDHFQGILHFGSVCRLWKEVADSTRLWLTCELNFYSTNGYYQAFESRLSDLLPYPPSPSSSSSSSSVRTVSNLKIIKGIEVGFNKTINLFDHQSCYYSRVYLIKVRRTQSVNFRAIFLSETSPLLASNQSLQSLSIPERVKRARSQMMKIYLRYHELWHWYATKILWLRRQNDYLRASRITYCRCCVLLSSLWLGLAIYLLADITLEENLTAASHSGFICLYIYGLQYLVLCILPINLPLLKELRLNSRSDLSAPLNWRPFSICAGYFVLILGALISLGLFHYALSINAASRTSRLYYGFAALPLCLASVISIILLNLENLPDRWSDQYKSYHTAVENILLITIPVGFILLGIHYDTTNQLSIEDAFLFWYPAASIIIIELQEVGHQIWKILVCGQELSARPNCVSVLAMAIRTILLVLMLTVMAWFNIIAVLDPNNSTLLSKGLFSLIAFLFCFTYAWYFAKNDWFLRAPF